MIQKNAIKYFNDQIHDISSHIQIAGLSQSADTVHDIRVGIKKIRTILKVFNFQKKNKRIRKLLEKEMMVLFKTTGNLRDFEVQLGFVKDYENLLKKEFFDLKEYLSDKINDRRRSLIKLLPENHKDFLNSLSLEVSSAIEFIPDEKITGRIEKYLVTATKKFENFKDHIIAKDLHKQRKILKEIRFCQEMMNQIYPEHTNEEQIVEIREIEDLLGRWKDYNELKRTVEKFVRRLKKSDVELVIKMNVLSDAISNDKILLLDNYHKIMLELELK